MTVPRPTSGGSPILPFALVLGALCAGGGAAILAPVAFPARTVPAELAAEATSLPDATAIDLLRTAMRGAGYGPAAEVALAIEPVPPQESETVVARDAGEPAPAPTQTPMAATARAVPLPVPRPPGLTAGGETARILRREPTRVRTAARPAPVPQQPAAEEPSLFDRLFGLGRPQTPGPALAYAAMDPGAVEGPWRKGLSAVPQSPKAPVPPPPGGGTAIYDISGRVVILPNGETLEAHSGLGASMDDPRHVHLSMRGPTPPGTYDLTEREALFHGVRALRLTPVGGGPAAHGRVGLLAHTYMLRAQPGASNGCVVFKDYDRFLQAYLRGEVKRLVVVASRAMASAAP